MPKPVYIICSLSGTQDTRTGLLSHFHVIEKLQITKLKADQLKRVPPLAFRMVAVWMQTEEDKPEEDFEYEVAAIMPPAGKKIPGLHGTFRFSKPLHRITIDFLGQLPFEGPGVMDVECSIRKTGADHWLKQVYPIFVEQVPTSET